MDSPWFLRFTALFLAIILYFSVQTEESKLKGKAVGNQMDVIHEVPVEVYYDDENLVVTGVPETVNVKIEGPMNIVQTTKLLKDFTLFVDLRTLTMGDHNVRIKSENFSDKLQVTLDPSTINVLIEEKITQTFRVDPEMNRGLLAENFKVVNMDVSPSTIEVTGAKSIVESISFVKATVSGDKDIDKSFEHQAKVRVLDRDLNKLNVTVIPEHVDVKVEVAENSKEVPVVLTTQGTPPANIAIEAITTEVKNVKLFGPSNVLDQIEQLEVNVDVSKVKGQDTLEINLKKPEGVSSMSKSKVKVKVKANKIDENINNDIEEPDDVTQIPNQPSETVKFENMQVTVTGLDSKFKSTLIKPASGFLTLTVSGQPDIMRTLKSTEFVLSVDASKIEAVGEINLPVTVKSRPDVEWAILNEEITLKIELA